MAHELTHDILVFLWIDNAAKGELAAMQAQIADGFDPAGVRDYDFRTAQHLSAAEGHLDVAEFLIDELDLNPMPVDRFGGSPVNDAVRHNEPVLEAFYIARGAVLLRQEDRIEGKLDAVGRSLTEHRAIMEADD